MRNIYIRPTGPSAFYLRSARFRYQVRPVVPAPIRRRADECSRVAEAIVEYLQEEFFADYSDVSLYIAPLRQAAYHSRRQSLVISKTALDVSLKCLSTPD